MPCYTVRTVTVEIGQVDEHLLGLAMQSLNIPSYVYNKQAGTIDVRGRAASTVELNQIKVAYSKQVVLAQAKRFGWQIKQTADNKFVINKRTT